MSQNANTLVCETYTSNNMFDEVSCETYTNRGVVGKTGKSAYEQAVEGGYQGTEEEFEQALASDIATVADNISDINAVGQSITEVNAVADNLTDVSTVADNVSDVNTVAGISSDVTQVAGISSAVQTVSSHDSEVTLVSDNMASVMTTASNIGGVNTVAGISADVSTVADNNSNVTAVAGNATNINTVANNISNVNTAATNMAAIIAAPTYASNAQKWAEGTDAEVQPLGGTKSSKGWANRAQELVESIGTVMRYKGSVANYAALQAIQNPTLGDTYNVLDTGANYTWDGSAWDAIGSVVDLSAYRTAAQQDVIDATKQDTLVSGTNIKTVNGNSLLGSGDVDALPTQTGQSGKFLTTDGTDASWANLPHKVEWAIYETTSKQQIKDWHDAGKEVLLDYALPSGGHQIYRLAYIAPNEGNIIFTNITGDGSSAIYLMTAMWDRQAYSLQQRIPAGTSGQVLTYTGIPGSVGSTALATVATTGAYSDLSGTPTIPTVNDATLTITQGGVTKGTFTANSGTDTTIALDAAGGSLPSQTGQSGKFLTTDGTDASWANLPIKVDSTKGSINIASANSTNDYAQVMIGTSAKVTNASSIAIGRYANATNGSVHIGNMNGTGTNSISIKGSATAAYAIQLGGGPIDTYSNTDANTFKVGNANGNYELMSADGTVPAARLNTMTGADGTNAGAKGAVPAPAATDNTKFLKGDGTWATVDALPSQTGNQGKYLTTNGTTASWDIPMAGLPMFYATYQPRKLNNASWLRADPYSWHSADVYVSAYAHLADNISGVTAQTETIAGTTITFYKLSDEIKVVLPDQQTNLDTIYNATGIGYYFLLDTTNRQFKLPRNIYGFTGYRGDVGGYVAESLPNVKGDFYVSNVAQSYNGNENGFDKFSESFTYTQDGGTNGSSWAYGKGAVIHLDASRSSAAYQNNAPVQQRATQAYLYFYVGNTVQNETSVDVAEMTEALNGKVDLSSSWGTLSTTYDNLTEPSNNGHVDITAPADGWLYYARRKSSGDSNTNMWAVNTSHTEHFQIEHDAYWGGTLVAILFPVKKGETIRFGRNNLTGDFVGCRFYYAQKTN